MGAGPERRVQRKAVAGPITRGPMTLVILCNLHLRVHLKRESMVRPSTALKLESGNSFV
jgi:hypothetical protein